MEVKTAFLNGELENKIFMQIPQGVEGREKLKSSFLKLRYLLILLKVAKRNVIIHWTSTDDQVTDMLIKASSNQKFESFCK